MGLQGGQGILFNPDLLRQRAVQGGIGQRRTLSAISRDQVHNGLGLSQPQLAVQEGAAGSDHLLAVARDFGSHTLHRQKMPVALPGAVKTVAFFTFQVILPLQRAAAQGALPRGKGFVPAHTSSL
jgi:hypothetical protein